MLLAYACVICQSMKNSASHETSEKNRRQTSYHTDGKNDHENESVDSEHLKAQQQQQQATCQSHTIYYCTYQR